MTQIVGRWLVPGPLRGPVRVLEEPVSFWGGVDARTGTIIDRSHPQLGASITDCVLALPGSRGSSGTPGVLGESLRAGTGPTGLILTKPDVNLVAGALAAETLYGTSCPVLLVDGDTFASLIDGAEIALPGPTGDR